MMRVSSWRERGALPTNLLLILGSIVCCFATVEIGLRLRSLSPSAPPLWSDRPKFYYFPRTEKARSDRFRRRERDFEYPAVKPGNDFRIAVVGDSFTFPPGMQFEDAFPKRLERMLNVNSKNNSLRAEVLNLGRWGASARSEVKAVRRALTKQPDLVILEITLNDAAGRAYAQEVRRLFLGFQRTVEQNWLLRHWYGLRYVAERWWNTESHRRYIEFHRQMFEDQKSWAAFTRALSRMQRQCAERGVPFAAVIFPFVHYPFDERYPFRDIHHKIDGFLSEHKVPHLDLLPAFAGVLPERLVLIPNGDKHPNEIAHRIAAEALYLWLSEERLIPKELLVPVSKADRPRV